MSLEEEKLNQNEWVRWLLKEDHNAELWNILAFWEKYKKKWEEMEQEFWGNRENYKFKNLLADYEHKKEILIKYFELWLLPEERKMLSSLSEIAKDKFYKQYIYNLMLYGGNPNYGWDKKFLLWNSIDCPREDFKNFISKHKNELKPWMEVSFRFKKIWDEWAKILAEEWENSLKSWMSIELSYNEIWPEWVKILAKEWKNSLKPWMRIDLSNNDIWVEWIKAIAKEWKNSLQPWMFIDFSNNKIWNEWIKAIAKEWKNSLKPWIQIHCREDDIWDEWIKAIAEEWKHSLKPNMQINLTDNKIWDEWADAMIKNLQLTDGIKIHVERNNISDRGKYRLKNWEWLYKNNWMNVTISVDNGVHDIFISSAKPIFILPWWQTPWWQFSWQITFTPKRKK